MKPKVYFTKTVTPEKVIEMYKQLDCKLPGNVAIKVHSGDYFGGLAQVYLFAVIGAVPTIIAMAKGRKAHGHHRQNAQRLRTRFGTRSGFRADARAARFFAHCSAERRKRHRKVKFKNHRPQATVFRACGRFFTSFCSDF